MTDKELAELREKICKIFGVFPEELEFNLVNGIGTRKLGKLLDLFTTYATTIRNKALDDAVDILPEIVLTDPDLSRDEWAELSGYNSAIELATTNINALKGKP